MTFGGGPDSDARVPAIGSAVGVLGSAAVVISLALVKAVPGARYSPSECGELYWRRIRAMGQGTTYWGRQIAYPNALLPAPVACWLLQCAVSIALLPAPMTRCLPQCG